MKRIFYILLLMVSASCYAQDSVLLYFNGQNVALTNEHRTTINSFFNTKTAQRVQLWSYYAGDDNVSNNRIRAELRLEAVRALILEKGVPFNIVYTSLQENDTVDYDLKITATFTPKNGAHVLKKTSLVQISEIEIARPQRPAENNGQQPTQAEQTLSQEESEKEVVLDMAAFKKDATVSLPNLIFQGSTHYFIASSERVLRALLKVMQARPDIKIELQGHVCCNPPGVDAYDMATGQPNLSIMRAKAVYNYLVEGGIAEDRLSYRGFGSSRRLYPDEKNDTEKMLNRRVEVLITEAD